MKERFLKRLNSTDLIKNSFILLSGTIIAQVFVLAAYPIISRLYTPSDLGLFAIYINIVNVAQVISAGRYDLTIMLPKQNKDAKSLFVASLLFGFALIVIFYLVLIFFHQSIIGLLNNPNLSSWIWLTPISIYMICVFQVTNYWLLRNRKFKQSSYLKIVQTVSISLITLIIGFFSINYGLIIGYFVGNSLMILYSLYLLKSIHFFEESYSFKRVIINMKRYKDFPIYNLIPTLANTASSSVPIFYMSSFYGDQIVGYVNLARQIVLAPISFISNSFSQVYFEKLMKTKNEGGKIFSDFLKIAKVLSMIGLLFLIAVSSTSFWAFKYVFGVKWEEAGIYASIMAISAAIQFVVSPLGIICPALDRIKIGSYWQFLFFIVVCSLYFAKSLSPISFFILYIGLESLVYLIYFLIIIMVVRNYDKKITL